MDPSVDLLDGDDCDKGNESNKKNKKVNIIKKAPKNKKPKEKKEVREEVKEEIKVDIKNEVMENSDEKQKEPILKPCKIPDFVDISKLKEYVEKDINGNKEYFDDLNITYKISDPKKAEWILNKSIKDGKLVGNGNTNVDISINDKTGIDVSVLTLNGNCTNEKSIMQNFSNSNDLDSLFNTNAGEKAVEIFRNKFIEKCSFKGKKQKEIKEIKDIYYMIFVCKNKNIYISCLKLYPENIPNMAFSGFTKQNKNITIDNFIDEKIGNVKLYKSKKRLELRLCKDILNNECTIKLL